jgi:hypothetical protein
VVSMSNDALHAYYTMDQKTFPCKKQSHVDGLTYCKQEWGWSDERSCQFKSLANCGGSMVAI